MHNENRPKGLQTLTSEDSKPSQDSGRKTGKVSVGTLARLWISMQSAFGHKWTSVMGDLPVTDTGALTFGGTMWIKELQEFTDERVCETIDEAITMMRDWPPNLPQFRCICLKIPLMPQVMLEIRSEEHSSFTRLVWHFLDVHNWRTARSDHAQRMLDDAYSLAYQYVMNGGPLPEKAPCLPPPEPTDEDAKAWHAMIDYGDSMGLDINGMRPKTSQEKQ